MIAGTLTIDIGDNLLQLLLAVVTIANTVIVLRRTKELKPNGGNSVHDKVEAIYREVAANERKTDTPREDS